MLECVNNKVRVDKIVKAVNAAPFTVDTIAEMEALVLNLDFKDGDVCIVKEEGRGENPVTFVHLYLLGNSLSGCREPAKPSFL